MIIGIDEVGRGAWAGPVVVAAVGLGGVELAGLTDSKCLSAKKRLVYAQQIRRATSQIGIGWVSARKIDEYGMSRALKLAAELALGQMDLADVDSIVVDGTIQLVRDSRATTMKKADLLVPSVSAASVIAKVARDNYMARLAGFLPQYGFERHVGYGTAAHRQAIDAHGASLIHRMSFAPMNTMPVTASDGVLSSGSLAETEAANFLLRNGFKIIDRNWKTKFCEIDIIAEKSGIVHFVEVKYRRHDRQGHGLDYITSRKLRQMKFAAELWLASHAADGCQLAAISLTGEPIVVESWHPLV